MKNLALALAGSVVLASCAAPASEPTPREEISRADEKIDTQRLIKRRLLTADPLERAVEGELRGDARVVAARFAITIAQSGQWETDSETSPFYYAAVVETVEPMDAASAVDLLLAAIESAGAASDLSERHVVVEGTRVAVPWATLRRTLDENPDLSALTPQE